MRLESLAATDGAREVEERDKGIAGRGLGALLGCCARTGVMGDGTALGVVGPLRLTPMMFVSSVLNLSRSVTATGCGARKVKLWPASSETRPILSLTWAAPSLLQKRAWGAVNITLLARRGSDYTSHAASA